MSDETVRIFPLGDSALTVEFGNSIDVDDNRRAIALAGRFEEIAFPGFIEAVPAYASSTIFYDIGLVRKEFGDTPTAFEAVRRLAKIALTDLELEGEKNLPLIEIPISFDPASAIDLDTVAELHGMSPESVIEIFLSRTYRVFMIGFLPGFSYMGEVDERIATPRKETPRTSVPKGSVGLAGRQTGIYSLESPGGWQIIGRTSLELFTPDADVPSLLRAGDQVRFVAER